MKREYGEFDDVPTKATGVFTKLEKAKAIIAFLISYGMTDDGAGLKPKMAKKYGLSLKDTKIPQIGILIMLLLMHTSRMMTCGSINIILCL